MCVEYPLVAGVSYKAEGAVYELKGRRGRREGGGTTEKGADLKLRYRREKVR